MDWSKVTVAPNAVSSSTSVASSPEAGLCLPRNHDEFPFPLQVVSSELFSPCCFSFPAKVQLVRNSLIHKSFPDGRQLTMIWYYVVNLWLREVQKWVFVEVWYTNVHSLTQVKTLLRISNFDLVFMIETELTVLLITWENSISISAHELGNAFVSRHIHSYLRCHKKSTKSTWKVKTWGIWLQLNWSMKLCIHLISEFSQTICS